MRKTVALNFLLIAFAAVGAAQLMGCSEGQHNEEPAPHDVRLLDFIGPELVDAEGNTTSSAVLEEKDYLLLYFSAEWCPPCRQFTPELVDFYNEYAQEGNVEVVFISLDHSESDMYDYMKGYSMNWPAVPYDRRDESQLAETYSVKGIPALVQVTPEGYAISHSGGEGGPFKMLDRLTSSFKDRP